MAKQYVGDSYFSTIVGGDEIHLTDDNIKLEDGTNISKINTNMFQSNYRLKEVHFSQVTAVNSTAFNGCGGLSSIYLPALSNYSSNLLSGVTGLQSLVLSGLAGTLNLDLSTNVSLQFISIPNITSLPVSAFANKSYLKEAHFPQLTNLSTSVFRDCFQLSTVTFSNIQSVPSYAFYGDTSLTNINGISFNSLKNIGVSAFYNCYHLNGISNLNWSSITNIGSFAFRYCSQIKTVTVDALSYCSSIGANAFSGCLGLNYISIRCSNSIYWNTIPSNALINSMYIYNAAKFNSCSTFSAWSLKSTLKYLYMSKFYNIPSYFCYSFSKLSYVSIPDTSYIGSYAFYNCSHLISDIYFRYTKEIGSYAFYNCSLLSCVEKRYTGDSITIHTGAFSGCNNLKTIEFLTLTSLSDINTFPFKTASLVSWLGLAHADILTATQLSSYPFFNKLRTLMLYSCSSICSSFAVNCDTLSTLILSDISYIGSEAFTGMNYCVDLRIQGSYIKTIGRSAFYNWASASNTNRVQNLTLSNLQNLQDISACAFQISTNHLDSYSRYISAYDAFGNRCFDLPKCYGIGLNAFHIEAPWDYGFYYWAISRMTLGSGHSNGMRYMQISSYAFSQNKFSSGATLEIYNCQYIFQGAFHNARGISTVYLENIGDIYASAFNTIEFEKLDIHGVKTIGSWAFGYNEMVSVFIRDYPILQSQSGCMIYKSAFFNCTNLQYFYIYNSYFSYSLASSNVFWNTKITSSTGYIYVRSKYWTAYRNAPGWSYFKNRIYSF